MKKRLISLFVVLVTLSYVIPNMFVFADEVDINTYVEQTQTEKEKYLEQRRIEYEAQIAERKQQSEQQEQNTIELYSTVSFAGGDGSKNNPYQISTPEQLDAIRNNLMVNYILLNDIDLSEWGTWVPICGKNENSPFTGVLDGNGYTIKNLAVGSFTARNANYTGLFVCLKNAIIKNLTIENETINISADNDLRQYIGGISSYVNGNVEINNCKTSGEFIVTTDGQISIGGMIGYP